MNWILASGSPRRRELLEMLGVPDLTIRPAKGPERATPGAGPEQTVRELSLHKAQEVAQTCAPEDIVIAADTIVYLDGVILGNWLVESCGWNEYLVTVMNMLLNFVTEYLFDTFVVFRGSMDTNEAAKKKAAQK